MQLVKWGGDFTKPWASSVLSPRHPARHARTPSPPEEKACGRVDAKETASWAPLCLFPAGEAPRRLNINKFTVLFFSFFFEEGTGWATNHDVDLQKKKKKMAQSGKVWSLLQHRLWVESGPFLELGSEPMSGVIAVAAR